MHPVNTHIVKTSPHVLTLDPAGLEYAKKNMTNTSSGVSAAVALLLSAAEQRLPIKPYSVTHKTLIPPGGTIHDYMSFGPYWWPDPAKSDGLPYIRKDGETNPSSKNDDTDSNRMWEMCKATLETGLAYYLTDDKKYARKTVDFIRCWFIEPATRMNPSLQFAQGIPGIVAGRGIGLIDSRHFWMVIDAIALIETAQLLSEDDVCSVKSWFRDFLLWMQTSSSGREEFAMHNNHGTYFDCQAVNYALFVEDRQLATRVAREAKTLRVISQISKSGIMWPEVERTKPFHYTMFNLFAMLRLGRYAEAVGIDYWQYELDNRSLRQGLDYAFTFLQDISAWPHGGNPATNEMEMAMPVVLLSERAYGTGQYAKLWKFIPDEHRVKSFDLLLWATPQVLQAAVGSGS